MNEQWSYNLGPASIVGICMMSLVLDVTILPLIHARIVTKICLCCVGCGAHFQEPVSLIFFYLQNSCQLAVLFHIWEFWDLNCSMHYVVWITIWTFKIQWKTVWSPLMFFLMFWLLLFVLQFMILIFKYCAFEWVKKGGENFPKHFNCGKSFTTCFLHIHMEMEVSLILKKYRAECTC